MKRTCAKCGGRPEIGINEQGTAHVILLCLPCAKGIVAQGKTPVLAQTIAAYERDPKSAPRIRLDELEDPS